MSNKRKHQKHMGIPKKNKNGGFGPGFFRLSFVQCFHGFLSSSKFGKFGFPPFLATCDFEEILGVL